MLVQDLIKNEEFKLITKGENIEKEIDGVFVNDLLSYVMSSAKENDVWITVQIHPNIVAVAELVGISAVIVPGGIKVEGITIEKADEKGIEILSTNMDAYSICKFFDKAGV